MNKPTTHTTRHITVRPDVVTVRSDDWTAAEKQAKVDGWSKHELWQYIVNAGIEAYLTGVDAIEEQVRND